MARLNAPTTIDDEERQRRQEARQELIKNLEDDQWYKAEIQEFAYESPSAEHPDWPARLRLLLHVADSSPEDVLFDRMSLRLGQNKAGQVSRLRAFLNALAGQPKATEPKWFDCFPPDPTFEWSYDGSTVAGRLSQGTEVLFRGERKTTDDGQLVFNVTGYAPVKKAPPAGNGARSRPVPAPVAPATPAAAEVNPDDIPF